MRVIPFLLLFICAPCFAARMITIDFYSGPILQARAERVLARYDYKVDYVNNRGKKTQIYASNPNDTLIPSQMIIDLSFASNFYEVQEPSTKSESIPVRFYFHESTTREQYIKILDDIQSMGVHVSYAKSERNSFFTVQVPPSKLPALQEMLRQYDFFDMYSMVGKNEPVQFLNDYRRRGTITYEVVFTKPGIHESVLAKLPANVTAVASIRYRSAPEGGVAVIMIPNKYSLVAGINLALAQYKAEGLVKLFQPEEYSDHTQSTVESFIIDPSSRRFALEPRAERIVFAVSDKKIPVDEDVLKKGILILRERLAKLPLDIYGFRQSKNSQGGYTELNYVEIQPNALTRQVLEKILTDFHIYPLHNDGTPNRSEEIIRLGHPSCDDLLSD